MKRAQITIFVIVGVLLISSVLLFFLFRNSIGIGNDALSPVIHDSVSETITYCMEKTLDLGLDWTLFEFGSYEEGGIFSDPNVFIVANDTGTGPHTEDREREVTRFVDFNKSTINESMNLFFDDFFSLCINDFEYLVNSGKNITFREPEPEFIVEDDFMILDLEFPITESLGESVNRYGRFSHRLDVDLEYIISTTNLFVDESVALNNLPSNLTESLEKDYPNLEIYVHYLYYGWPETPYVQYVLGFEKSEYRVSFIINYDWYNIHAPNQTVDELFDELEEEFDL